MSIDDLRRETNMFSRKHGQPFLQFNDPKSPHLPPVGCNIIIKIGDTEQLAERTGYIESRGDMMEYKLASTGELVIGNFWWCYP